MNRLLNLVLGLCLLALTILLFPALAIADDGTVTIPFGDWINQLAPAVATLILAVVGWLMRKLPGSVVDILKTMKAEQLLQKAVDYGLNAAAGATKDKTLSVKVGNDVIANAVQYVVDHAPGWLVGWLGGEDAIAQMIIARLHLGADAAVVSNGQGKVALVSAG